MYYLCTLTLKSKRLFHMIDTDRSGRVNERDFVEFWVYLKSSGGMGHGLQSPGAPGRFGGSYPNPYGAPPQMGGPGFGIPYGNPYAQCTSLVTINFANVLSMEQTYILLQYP